MFTKEVIKNKNLPYTPIETKGIIYSIGDSFWVHPKWWYTDRGILNNDIITRWRGKVTDKKTTVVIVRGKYYRQVTDYKIKYITKDDNLTQIKEENWFSVRHKEVFYWAGVLFDDFFQTRTYLYLNGKKFGYIDCV